MAFYSNLWQHELLYFLKVLLNRNMSKYSPDHVGFILLFIRGALIYPETRFYAHFTHNIHIYKYIYIYSNLKQIFEYLSVFLAVMYFSKYK